jgi:CRP-like cAMP-binding protein
MDVKLEDKITALHSFSLLENFSFEDLNTLASEAIVSKFQKGDLIYKENSLADRVYFVFTGKVKLASTAQCGKILIKEIIHKKDVFGEQIFSENTARSEYSEVLENNTFIYSIPKSTVVKFVNSNNEFAHNMVQLIMQRMNNLEQRMKNFIFLKAKSRISEFLGRIGTQRGIKIGLDECLINHGLSHKDIAYMTDTSRQTVARVLGELKKDNLIHFSARKPSKILIRNIAALQAV